MKFLNHIVFVSLCFVGISCQNNWLKTNATETNSTEQGVALAKVGNKTLYLKDVPAQITANNSEEDSLSLLKSYVQHWTFEETLYAKAQNSNYNKEDIELRVAKYKKDLILADYRKSRMQNINVNVDSTEKYNYYQKHKDYFIFKKNFYEVEYIVLPKNTSNLQEIRRALSKGQNSNFIDGFCAENPSNCFLETPALRSKDFLTEELKLPKSVVYVHSNFKYHYMPNDLVMIYRISGIKKAGETAPLYMVEKEVETLAIHQKKEQTIEELENKNYQKAKNEQNIEIYIK